MRRKAEGEGNEVGMELKYCEHCGGLWVRERGAGIVYCHSCQAKVADLPAPRKRKCRLILPVRPPTVVEEHGFEVEAGRAEADALDLDALELDPLDVDPPDLDPSDVGAMDFDGDGAA